MTPVDLTPEQMMILSRRIENRAAMRGLVVLRVECTPSTPLWAVEFTNGRRIEAQSFEEILHQVGQ